MKKFTNYHSVNFTEDNSVRAKLDALPEVPDSVSEYSDTVGEYLGDELDVLIDVLINRLGFAEYSHDGDDPIFEVVSEYVNGTIEYEALLAKVAESHELHALLIFGDDYDEEVAKV